jgi:3-hydroxyacyl-CoA dehydrogenase/enoyl-CoA hydratase/3-hydroxybutyryl-CoA epimerase
MQAEGLTYQEHPADPVVDRMLEAGRAGKLAGGGFYEYPAQGKKHLWEGLKTHFQESEHDNDLQEIKDRLLYIQAIETVRCLDEKVLTSVRDANIGSIMGIGYPVWTGGILQFINQTGLEQFIERASFLAKKYGKRFEVPQLLKNMAKDGLIFKD